MSSSTDAQRGEAGRPHPHIVILGGGFVGVRTALTLRQRLGHDATITIVDQRQYMTYHPFLPEVAAASIEPRHTVVPMRGRIRGVRVVDADILEIDHAHQQVRVATDHAEPHAIRYDELVVAVGSVSRTLPIPGLQEMGMGFKNVEEAVYLRNHALDRLSLAASTEDADHRRRLLTFVFVGGGFAGVEAFAEVQDMTMAALRDYPELDPHDLRFVLVELAPRILPELGERLGDYAVKQLTKRGMEVRMGTTLKSCEGGRVVLSDGEEFEADTVVWTAGVRPSPVLSDSDLPRGPRGHVIVSPTLQVTTSDGTVVPHAWAAGDCAQVPDLTQPQPAFCAPSAQHAVRQARHLGDAIARHLNDRPLKNYRHRHMGLVASLGLHRGVAEVLGIRLRGWPAWAVHRVYHLSQIPTAGRKARVIADWMASMWFRRDLVPLPRMHDPVRAFRDAANL